MKLSTADLSSITEKPSIFEAIEFLTGCDTTTYPYADRLRDVNSEYYLVVTDINETDGIWPWDDSNKTDLPRADDDLVDAQQNYALPDDLSEIIRVEVLDSEGVRKKLYPISEKDIPDGALSEFLDTNGLPIYYRPIADEIELYPIPATASVTTTNGLRIYYKRNQVLFDKNDAAVEPGFDARFHEVIHLGCALRYFMHYPNRERQAEIKEIYWKMRRDIPKFYARRNREAPTNMTFKRRAFK